MNLAVLAIHGNLEQPVSLIRVQPPEAFMSSKVRLKICYLNFAIYDR